MRNRYWCYNVIFLLKMTWLNNKFIVIKTRVVFVKIKSNINLQPQLYNHLTNKTLFYKQSRYSKNRQLCNCQSIQSHTRKVNLIRKIDIHIISKRGYQHYTLHCNMLELKQLLFLICYGTSNQHLLCYSM